MLITLMLRVCYINTGKSLKLDKRRKVIIYDYYGTRYNINNMMTQHCCYFGICCLLLSRRRFFFFLLLAHPITTVLVIVNVIQEFLLPFALFFVCDGLVKFKIWI
jgi:hypothetical protein